MPTAFQIPCFLFDNGSLRPDATRSLRGVAKALQSALGCEVRPVSLLHSTAIDPADLDGEPAELLEPALDRFLASGGRDAVLLPLFFGPSAALTDYLPARLASLAAKHGDVPGLHTAKWIIDVEAPSDTRIAEALAERTLDTMAARQLVRPAVVLVDHGTPQRAVTVVRELLGRQVRALLGANISSLVTASMERRDGPDYAFNEPLLASALAQPPSDRGDVVVALQFLAPGRHAGADGDIATICREAEAGRPELRTHITDTLGAHPKLISVLADRYRAAVGIKPDSSAR